MSASAPDVRVPLLRQQWRRVTFLHWRVEPDAVQRLLPAGLTVQTHDGSAWLGLIPLHMVDVRPAGLPALPGLSSFPETNLRTYVSGPDGRAGVYFFSLDADSAWITVGARVLLGAPYFRAAADISDNDGGVRYRGTRRARPGAAYRIGVRPGAAVEPDEAARWLTDRPRAFTRHAGAILQIPVRHEPWPLRQAAVTELEETLTAAAGLPVAGAPDSVLYSDGVREVAFGVSRRSSPRRPWSPTG